LLRVVLTNFDITALWIPEVQKKKIAKTLPDVAWLALNALFLESWI